MYPEKTMNGLGRKAILINLFDLIKNGSDYLVWLEPPDTFGKYMEKDMDEYHFLVPNDVLMDRWGIEKLSQKYYIHELFDLANCYLSGSNKRYTYWHISKKQPDYVKISIYNQSAHPYRDDTRTDYLVVPDKFNGEFESYISLLEQWVNNGLKPKNKNQLCVFRKLSTDDFDSTKPFCHFYRKANDELRELLKSADIVPLKEVANVIRVMAKDFGNDASIVKTLNNKKTPSYPYIPELATVDNLISNQLIHEQDIVAYGNEEFFLVDKESEYELYAPIGTELIRAKKICPEYLYLYLNSKIAKRILRAFFIPLGKWSSTSLIGSLEEFPIIKPEKNDDYYKEEFLKISSPNTKFYIAKKENDNPKTIGQALENELLEKIKLNNDAVIKRQIEEDISELNTCFENKAYKSTLIMAGSIMEALLIDWLSEMRGIDYFKETLYKRKYDRVNNSYVKDEAGNYIYIDKKADLADYIDEIRDIKRPAWMEEAREAHKIREKRNLVHAKLCLKENVEINEETCVEVLNYLKNIINSRWE